MLFATPADAAAHAKANDRIAMMYQGNAPASDAAWLGLPDLRTEGTGTPVLIAKRGIKIGKVLDFFRGRSGGDLRGSERADGKSRSLSTTLRGLGIRGIAVYGLLFLTPLLLFLATFRFLRSMLRGVFVSVRDAEIVDARLTRAGKYRPIVAFEDRAGKVYQALAGFETRRDPRGDWAAVEITGKTFKVVPFRRSFVGVIGYVLGPLALSVITLIAAYFLDTAV